MYETIELERRGAASIIRLNRPEALNAWNATLGDELLDAVHAVAADDGVRAVCVTGAGRAFSSGGDLRDMTSRPRTPDGHIDVRTPLTAVYHPILTALRTMPKPVLAAINGPAVGIGCSLALSCDLLVAAESSYLMLAFAGIGLAPDGGASALVAARAGGGRAAEMALLGDRVTASTALRWGLVNEVLPDLEFEDGAHATLDRLAAGPTRSYAGAKRQLNAWLYAGLDAQLELEADIQQELVASADFAEGVAAFLEKRHPEFEGR
jgi:2-(1,2-epoxy-1,2-dihydrophenyl)acetyl-CoA isomerase